MRKKTEARAIISTSVRPLDQALIQVVAAIETEGSVSEVLRRYSVREATEAGRRYLQLLADRVAEYPELRELLPEPAPESVS